MTSKTEKRQRRRLTDYDVLTIRAAVREGAPLEDLAEGYGVSARAIRNAAYGEQWDRLPGRLVAPGKKGWLRRVVTTNSNLNEGDVREIRALHARLAIPDIAERFNVSLWTVDLICRGVLWKHVL